MTSSDPPASPASPTSPSPPSASTALPARLLELGAECGRRLIERGESVAVGEGSCGGLMSAALLAVPGASNYYRGGAVIYTGYALSGMLSGRVERPDPLQGATEAWALHLARASRVHMRATWGIGEGGATGPSGNRYGNPAGHAWLAVAGESGIESTRNLSTGDDDRLANMVAFAQAGLTLLAEALDTTD